MTHALVYTGMNPTVILRSWPKGGREDDKFYGLKRTYCPSIVFEDRDEKVRRFPLIGQEKKVSLPWILNKCALVRTS